MTLEEAQFWSGIANIVVAVVAVITLAYSIWLSIETSKTTRDTSNTLKTVQRTMASLTEPVVQFVGYDWTNEEQHQLLSHENPPTGILVKYANASNIPIQIERTELDVFYGDRKFDDAISVHEPPTSQIVMPGKEVHALMVQPESFQKYLGNPKEPLAPPFLSVKLTITYSRLDSAQEKYRYRTHQRCMFFPNSGQRLTHPVSEVLEKLQI